MSRTIYVCDAGVGRRVSSRPVNFDSYIEHLHKEIQYPTTWFMQDSDTCREMTGLLLVQGIPARPIFVEPGKKYAVNFGPTEELRVVFGFDPRNVAIIYSQWDQQIVFTMPRL